MVDQNLIATLSVEDEEDKQMLADAYGERVADGDFDGLLDSQGKVADFKPGTILNGKIIGKAGDDFLVDVGLKSEGILDKSEFDNPEEVERGDVVEVLLEDIESE